jgi:hypothetical protein
MKYCLLTLIVLFFLGLFSRCDSKQEGYLGIRFSSNNISNQWNCKFYYLNGVIQGRFTANEDTLLIYSSNLKKGSIVFQLFNSKDSLLVAFPANNTTDTIRGVFGKGEKYQVHAIATKAKGRFDFKME